MQFTKQRRWFHHLKSLLNQVLHPQRFHLLPLAISSWNNWPNQHRSRSYHSLLSNIASKMLTKKHTMWKNCLLPLNDIVFHTHTQMVNPDWNYYQNLKKKPHNIILLWFITSSCYDFIENEWSLNSCYCEDERIACLDQL